jgi:hypothetical protein
MVGTILLVALPERVIDMIAGLSVIQKVGRNPVSGMREGDDD